MKQGICKTIIRNGLIAAVLAAGIGVFGSEKVYADVAIDATNFPDINFREYVRSSFDWDKSYSLSDAEILSAAFINASNMSITSFEGIEYLTSLRGLSCVNDSVNYLDVSKNTALISLDCTNSFITSLDLSHNTALEKLVCSQNNITSLDLGNNTALKSIWCNNNKLTSLDISKNLSLEELNCNENAITSLNVAANTKLTTLYCGSNKLTSLDVSKNTALDYLDCDRNQLTTLDVRANTALTGLSCEGNQLTTLDLSQNGSLTFLDCANNNLGNLDVTNNPQIEVLYCTGNGFSTVNIVDLEYLTDHDGQIDSQEDLLIVSRTKEEYEEGDSVDFYDLVNDKKNKNVPKGSTFTITSPADGDTPGTVAFDGVKDENSAAVKIPSVIYVNGVPYKVTTVSPTAFEKSSENAGYKVIDNRVKSLTVQYTGQVDQKKVKKSVNIPQYSNYRGIRFKVTSIAAKSFRKNTKVKKVKLASSITLIGDNCFEGCSNLEQVIVGKGLRQIGKNAFKNCKKLTLIKLKGTKLKKVGKAALKGVNTKCKIVVKEKSFRSYGKLFKGKGQKKSVKVVKA